METSAELPPLPMPVIITATHSCSPRECRADGVAFGGGRFVIDYPFRWSGSNVSSHDDASEDASLNITGLLQNDGTTLQGDWKDIGLMDLTEHDVQALEDRISALQASAADFDFSEAINNVIRLYQRIAERAIRVRSNTSVAAQ